MELALVMLVPFVGTTDELELEVELVMFEVFDEPLLLTGVLLLLILVELFVVALVAVEVLVVVELIVEFGLVLFEEFVTVVLMAG